MSEEYEFRLDEDWRCSEDMRAQYRRALLAKYVGEAQSLGADAIQSQVLASLWLLVDIMPASPPQYRPMYDPSGKITGWREP